MNGDEMVFGDIQYREPVRATRPDLDARLACVAYGVPGPDDLPIFLERRAADAIERHALRDTSVELGGILLGQECIDEETRKPFVKVTESLEAKHYENTQASFTYTHDSWEEISRERDRLHPGLDIVGWYHTHPDFGIFLSSHDLFIHRNFFSQPLQVAYVVDPIRQTRGFFQWRADRLDQVGGFHLSADRSERLALARLVNDLESIPNGDAGGGGALSPRLEAELIAMLSRPHQAASSSIDRAQAAATYGVLGLFAGALLSIGVVWLYLLQQSLVKQTQSLEALQSVVSRTDEAQRIALDALIARTDPGASSKTLMANYSASLKERERLEGLNKDQSTEKKVLTEATRRLADEVASLARSRDELSAKASKFEKLSIEQDDALHVLGKTEKGQIARKYDVAWYAAIVGWIVAILAGLGLVANLAARAPLAGPAVNEGPRVIYKSEEPPHSIS